MKISESPWLFWRSSSKFMIVKSDRDVQHRRRLVGDQQSRSRGERSGDADALALAARELVGIALKKVLHGREAHLMHEVFYCSSFFTARDNIEGAQRLRDGVGDRVERVKRRVGILKDHLDLAAMLA